MLCGFLQSVAFLIALVMSSAADLSAATVEERLDQINRLPEQGRNESLEREARKEGELV
jgi:hypothetical protein